MGLDLTELVLETQDEFGVLIADDVVPLLVGDLCDVTLLALRRQHPERFADANYAEEVWLQLQGMIVRQLAVDPEKVVRSANFVTDLGCV